MQQVRLRHATTRLYLRVSRGGALELTPHGSAPDTVFRPHPVIQEQDEVPYESYARFEHVLSGLWLHVPKGTAAMLTLSYFRCSRFGLRQEGVGGQQRGSGEFAGQNPVGKRHVETGNVHPTENTSRPSTRSP